MTTDDLVARVEAALRALAAADQPVTFTSVAEQAELARATLYRNPTLRALVDEHRLGQIDTRSLSGLSTEIGHVRTALEAVAEHVRGHEETNPPPRTPPSRAVLLTSTAASRCWRSPSPD